MPEGEHDEFARIFQLMSDAELEPFAYSGRGMFGASCLAVTLDRSECQSEWDAATRFTLAAMDQGLPAGVVEDYLDFLSRPESDAMGRDRVLYWPRLRWPEGFDPR